MSTASITINTALQLTLHLTVPTLPDTYCISPVACNINPTIPPNIIQTFLAQFLGLILPPPSTSVVSSICEFLIPLSLSTPSSYQYHCTSQWSHSLALSTLDHQSYQFPQLDLAPLSHLPYLFTLTDCAQSFPIDLPTCSNWTNYLHPTDPAHHLLLGKQLMWPKTLCEHCLQ